ncbi:MAG: phage tail tape measure protein [Proteobacteria bacterium]|nr:phage tail tape measure protein [Pseudomonadota bacterium]
MTIAGELINILGFKLEGEGNLAKFNDGMDKAANRATSLDSRVKSLAVAAGLTTTGLVTLGTSAVRNFAGFERTMTRISNTANSTSEQTAKAAEEVQRLATKFALPIQDSVEGLETLVSAGKSLEEAMAFLPSVLATAQASGSSVADVANTALKTADALGLQSDQMQRAFDVMVAGGKAGQFEMKDMAAFIPTLANAYAGLGYKGEDGLKRLIVTLQTLREDTANSAKAANQAENIFTKMFSQEVEKNFADFNVDIRSEIDKATKSGEGALEAYVRITKQILADNPTAKISDLFADTEFQAGMRSLTTSADSIEKFWKAVNDGKVDGSVYADLQKVTNDTQASIDKMSGTWDKFLKTLGGSLSGPVSETLDTATDWLSFDDAIGKGLEKRGMSYDDEQIWRAQNWFDPEERARAAREGGYVDPRYSAENHPKDIAPYAYERLGRLPNRPASRSGKQQPSWFNRFMYGAAADEGFDFRAHNGIDVKAGNDGQLADIAAKVDGMNSHLAKMTGSAGTEAVITDARTDARDQSVKVGGVNVVVNGVENASAAVGAKVGAAIGGAVGNAGAARFEKDDQL